MRNMSLENVDKKFACMVRMQYSYLSIYLARIKVVKVTL